MFYIVFGIVMVVFAWLQAAFGKMQKYKNEARVQWVRVDALLQTRTQYILRLLELAHENELEAESLLAEIYELGGGYCKSGDREDISSYAEKVTPLEDRLLQLAKENSVLESNEEFLELESSLTELEDEIEIQSEKYNHFIDLYNAHIENPKLRFQIAILSAPHLKGIHIRQNNLPVSGSQEEQS